MKIKTGSWDSHTSHIHNMGGNFKTTISQELWQVTILFLRLYAEIGFSMAKDI